MAYTKYSLTPADNNAAPPNGAPEGMLPSAVNDTMRDMMAQIRDVGDGIRGGTYTMTAPVITGGSITGVALSGNTLTNPVITGGSINNTTVGATTRSSGAFTTLTSNGATTFTAGTASTSTTTGTAVITGGLGVSGRINAANFDGIVGANTAAAGNFTTLGASSTATLNTLASSGATLTGGSINGMAIGGSTAAAGNFTTLGATGVATFSAGTVSAPAITTTGDTNTGIFFPAADTIAFTEGGAESMRITSAGDVGIGTNSPSYKLDVTGTARVTEQADFANAINLTTSTLNYLYFNDALAFARNGVGERMRIASNGRVAIGTSIEDPAAQLRVLNGLGSATGNPWEQSQLTIISNAAMAQGVGPVINFEGNYITGTGSNASFAWIKAAKNNGTSGSATGDLILGSRGGNIRFSLDTTNQGLSTEAMRIDSSGNVFIGTTTAGGKFNVSGISNITASSGAVACSNNAGVKILTGATSGTLTTVATLTKPANNSPMRRIVFTVTSTNDGGDTGYAVACSVREVLMSNYGGSTSIIKSTELSNNIGSINAGVISVALTTAAALSGTNILLQATATITGSASAGLTARVMTKVEIISDSVYQDITFA